jgi:dihydrofolate reductase
MELTAIAAVARNGVIGARGAMPWHVPEDFRRFKRVTMGGVLVMGRATFDSVGALPGRQMIVITRSQRLLGQIDQTGDYKGVPAGDKHVVPVILCAVAGSMPAQLVGEPGDNQGYPDDSVRYVSSLAQALSLADTTGKQVFIAGGSQIYRLAWPQLTRLDITEIDAEPDGDAFFPTIADDEWREVSRDPHDGFSFVTYVRR